jgi:hypothetical protein
MATPLSALNQVMQQSSNLLVNGIKSFNNFGLQMSKSLDATLSQAIPLAIPANIFGQATAPLNMLTQTVSKSLQGIGQAAQQPVSGLTRGLDMTLRGLGQTLNIKQLNPFGGLAAIGQGDDDTAMFGEAARDEGIASKTSFNGRQDETSMF